jgi:integrase/recombinase XerD
MIPVKNKTNTVPSDQPKTQVLNNEFELFMREKKFLANVTEKTLKWYRSSWVAYQGYLEGEKVEGEISKAQLNGFMIHLRERGISSVSANTYARALNSFLSWLYENDYLKDHLKIKKLKEEQKVIATYTREHLETFFSWKPKRWYEWRMYALICTLIDTGARIDIELLSLKKADVDFENLLIKLMGKGGKERFVPMSLELRRILYRWLQKHEFEYVFPTKRGYRQSYRNVLRDFYELCESLGITGVRTSFHTFRHTFAVEYLRNGGGELYLQKALGHTTLQMTRRYANLNEQDLKDMHIKTSLLSRLR